MTCLAWHIQDLLWFKLSKIAIFVLVESILIEMKKEIFQQFFFISLPPLWSGVFLLAKSAQIYQTPAPPTKWFQINEFSYGIFLKIILLSFYFDSIQNLIPIRCLKPQCYLPPILFPINHHWYKIKWIVVRILTPLTHSLLLFDELLT